MFKKINFILENFLAKKNLKENKEREEIERIWNEKIEKNIKKNATIIGFDKGNLLIKTTNPTWKMELSLIKNKLKKKLTTRKKQ